MQRTWALAPLVRRTPKGLRPLIRAESQPGAEKAGPSDRSCGDFRRGPLGVSLPVRRRHLSTTGVLPRGQPVSQPAPNEASTLRAVGKLNNPAGRLHYFLASLNEAQELNDSRRETWARVLETTQPNVPIHLWKVADLLGSTYRAVSQGDADDPYRQLAIHHMNEWAAPFVEDLDQLTQPVSQTALLALNTISAFLSDTVPEGTVPDSEQRESLRNEIAAVIKETNDSDEAPPELRQLIVERLHQILWALDHVHIGGPAAVAAAVERLAGTLTMRGREAVETPPARRSMSVALKLYGAFLSGPVVGHALNAWGGIAKSVLELGP